MRTFANLRAEGDVLRGRAFDLLLGRHLELSWAGLRARCEKVGGDNELKRRETAQTQKSRLWVSRLPRLVAKPGASISFCIKEKTLLPTTSSHLSSCTRDHFVSRCIKSDESADVYKYEL